MLKIKRGSGRGSKAGFDWVRPVCIFDIESTRKEKRRD
jgi:hypothetical protein